MLWGARLAPPDNRFEYDTLGTFCAVEQCQETAIFEFKLNPMDAATLGLWVRAATLHRGVFGVRFWVWGVRVKTNKLYRAALIGRPGL